MRVRRVAEPQQEAAAPQADRLRRRRKDDVEVELALQYDDGYNENTFTFVNNINTHEGGTHLTGFKSALTRTINEYAKKIDALKKDDFTLSRRRRARGADLRAARQGRASRSSRGRPRPSWATREVEGIVKTVVNEHLGSFLEEHPPVARAIIEKAVSAARAREAARKARDLVRKKSALEGGVLPGKLADCSLERSGAVRDLPGRGRLGRRLGQAGARPLLPGDPAAARARSSTSRGPASTRSSPTRRSARSSPRSAPGSAEEFTLDERALPQDHPHDRRRRGRRAHPHPAAHVLLPADAGADRGGLHLHRAAAALPRGQGQGGVLRLRRGRSATSTPSGCRTTGRPTSASSATRAWAR